MAEQLEEQAGRTVRRLLYNNWTPSETLGYDPTLDPASSDDALPLHFGNYNSDLADPQISVAQPQGEATVGGRWSGKNMQTDSMNQFRRGFVLVQCWAESGADYNGETAKEVVSTLRQEVEDVMSDFDRGPTDGGANDGVITSFSTQWEGRLPDPTNDSVTPTWQSQVRVVYDWDRQA